MSRTQYGDISPRTAAYAAKDMLSHAEPVLILSKFGQMKPLPKNKTDLVKFRRPVPYGAVTAPLVEGVTPSTQTFQYEDVQCRILQWGAVNETTDKVVDTHEDPVLKDMSMLAGEQAGETVENVVWGVIRGGTNVMYANGAGRGDVNTAISLNKVRAAVRALKAQRGKMITSILGASANISTRPIEASYVAVTHTDMDADIRALPGFTPTAEYGSRQVLCPEELGTVENVRFITSPMLNAFPDAGDTATGVLSTTGTDADVYPVIILAKEAYGLVPLKGPGAIQPMVLNPGQPDKSDPLGQRGYVSWKAWFNALVLNQSWMVRLECAATSL